ncbi:hypothetical protein HMPREF1337_00543 [Enterococcus faecalis ERV65]|uniref:Uncharacterized protein n=1 Tax=Enterococcus faecalis ERV63 TaxID=1134793 RepID=A0AAV3GI12_ENTFL|nr:hypothetical protein HMPREF0348_3011 [Enterococcus faecalis TX0104]EJU85493.1 hypothetical protein HMPREF1328_02878 [Enterococcus faecalis ERV103]EJU90450.1 hypothetical protein HMPREF1329_00543 [Enterococcus faecalis ERV116]EJU95457.1 hypothetical protein HMPREF1331_02678 [Enterococcus faecalis ERV25]EJU96630.1 hypothetical protein HMPREF1332_02509 [Enterococcus faecalis ERV31]EJU97215.1 hypothetical protein HMPREF1330_01758 [Enterococcus faecalis ERV129]EJV03251.1 hypothetical protein HM
MGNFLQYLLVTSIYHSQEFGTTNIHKNDTRKDALPHFSSAVLVIINQE